MSYREKISGHAAELLVANGEILYAQPGHKVLSISGAGTLRLGIWDNDSQTMELLDGPALLAAVIETRAANRRRIQDAINPPDRL